MGVRRVSFPLRWPWCDIRRSGFRPRECNFHHQGSSAHLIQFHQYSVQGTATQVPGQKTMKQTTFDSLAWSIKGKVAQRERFLSEMEAVIPWKPMIDLNEPRYPNAGSGMGSACCPLIFCSTGTNLWDLSCESGEHVNAQ